MWLGERTAQRECGEELCRVGTVSTGGQSPMVVLCGEAQSARLAGAGALYIPKAEDEVLTMTTAEGEVFILGTLPSGGEERESGTLTLKSGGAKILLKDDGKIEITGEVYINGEKYVPASQIVLPAAGGESSGA